MCQGSSLVLGCSSPSNSHSAADQFGLQLPEQLISAAGGFHETAAALAAHCAAAQEALGVLCMRRAVMSVGIGSSEAVEGVTMMQKVSAQLDEPKQLLLMLKLALAAGGAGFDSLFDGLRPILRNPPGRLVELPLLLREDAIRDVRLSLAAMQTVESTHPLRNVLIGRQCVLTIPGASSIRVEADSRTQIPPNFQLVVLPGVAGPQAQSHVLKRQVPTLCDYYVITM